MLPSENIIVRFNHPKHEGITRDSVKRGRRKHLMAMILRKASLGNSFDIVWAVWKNKQKANFSLWVSKWKTLLLWCLQPPAHLRLESMLSWIKSSESFFFLCTAKPSVVVAMLKTGDDIDSPSIWGSAGHLAIDFSPGFERTRGVINCSILCWASGPLWCCWASDGVQVRLWAPSAGWLAHVRKGKPAWKTASQSDLVGRGPKNRTLSSGFIMRPSFLLPCNGSDLTWEKTECRSKQPVMKTRWAETQFERITKQNSWCCPQHKEDSNLVACQNTSGLVSGSRKNSCSWKQLFLQR